MKISEKLKLERTYSFAEYLELVDRLASHDDTSGPEKTPERIEATRLNRVRLNRIYKTAQLRADLQQELKNIDAPMQWLLMLESWCGDGAQLAPVIARMAHQSPFISLKIILRDEYPAIMDRYLTNGKRSIPKLIVFDGVSLKELGTWGPRPVAIQEAVTRFKEANPGVAHADLVKHVQLLYARDQTHSAQSEFVQFIHGLMKKQKEQVAL